MVPRSIKSTRKIHQVNDINKKIAEHTYVGKSMLKGQELARRRAKQAGMIPALLLL